MADAQVIQVEHTLQLCFLYGEVITGQNEPHPVAMDAVWLPWVDWPIRKWRIWCYDRENEESEVSILLSRDWEQDQLWAQGVWLKSGVGKILLSAHCHCHKRLENTRDTDRHRGQDTIMGLLTERESWQPLSEPPSPYWMGQTWNGNTLPVSCHHSAALG